MTTELTYPDILARCKGTALEMTPDLPTSGDYDSWEDFLNELDDFDCHNVHEEVEGWDWSIYTHYGLTIIQLLPQSNLNDAEQQWLEWTAHDIIWEQFGVYEVVSQVAYFALCALLTEALEEAISDLKDLAETQLENLEG